MKRKLQWRRIWFFGGLSVGVGFLLLLLIVFPQRDLLRQPDWKDLLGSGDRPRVGIGDPMLDMDGLIYLSSEDRNVKEGNRTIYRAMIDPGMKKSEETDPLARVEQFWCSRGLRISRQNERVLAEADGGIIYAAAKIPPPDGLTATPEEILAPYADLALWKIVKRDERRNDSSLKDRDNNVAQVLPPLPPNVDRIERGVKDAPGYAVMVSLGARAPRAFQTLLDDLRSRGWEFFGGQEIHVAEQLQSTRPGIVYSATLFHPKASLGCQMIVGEDPTSVRGSKVLLGLF